MWKCKWVQSSLYYIRFLYFAFTCKYKYTSLCIMHSLRIPFLNFSWIKFIFHYYFKTRLCFTIFLHILHLRLQLFVMWTCMLASTQTTTAPNTNQKRLGNKDNFLNESTLCLFVNGLKTFSITITHGSILINYFINLAVFIFDVFCQR